MGTNIRGSTTKIDDLQQAPGGLQFSGAWIEVEADGKSWKMRPSAFITATVTFPGNATTSTRGLVLQAVAMPDITASGTTADAVAASLNILLAKLRTSGALAP